MGEKPGKPEWGPPWGGKPPNRPKPEPKPTPRPKPKPKPTHKPKPKPKPTHKPKPEPPPENEWDDDEYPGQEPEWKPKPTERPRPKPTPKPKPKPEPEPEKDEEEEKYPDREPDWQPAKPSTAKWFKCPKKSGGGCNDYKDSLFQNRKNCHTFIQCVPNGKNKRGKPVVMHCPDGLLWNDHDKDCDYPEFATCKIDDEVKHGMALVENGAGQIDADENASVSNNLGTIENSGKAESSSTDENPGTADNNQNDVAILANVSTIFQ